MTAASIVVVAVGIGLWLRSAGQPQAEGHMQLVGLDAPVTVHPAAVQIPVTVQPASAPTVRRTTTPQRSTQ